MKEKAKKFLKGSLLVLTGVAVGAIGFKYRENIAKGIKSGASKIGGKLKKSQPEIEEAGVVEQPVVVESQPAEPRVEKTYGNDGGYYKPRYEQQNKYRNNNN